MNGDGKPDLVSVRMDVYQPFTNDGRVVLWLNHWGQAPPSGRTQLACHRLRLLRSSTGGV